MTATETALSPLALDSFSITPPVDQRPALESPPSPEKVEAPPRRYPSKLSVTFDVDSKGKDNVEECDSDNTPRRLFSRKDVKRCASKDSVYSNVSVESVQRLSSKSLYGPRAARKTSFALGSTPPLAKRKQLECPDSPSKGGRGDGEDMQRLASKDSVIRRLPSKDSAASSLSVRRFQSGSISSMLDIDDLRTPAVRSESPRSEAPWAPEAVRMKQPCHSPGVSSRDSIKSVASEASGVSMLSTIVTRQLEFASGANSETSSSLSRPTSASKTSKTTSTSWFSQMTERLRRLY